MSTELQFPAAHRPGGVERPGSAGRQPGGQGRRRRVLAPWALATAVLAGQAMASLDAAIVNVAGPVMSRDLHLSGAELQLAIYSYLLTYAVALVTGARLGGRYGFGRVFGYGAALFTVSSLACGLAVSPVMLVAARTTQGLGAALLVSQVLSLLQVTFDGERRRRAMSLYGLVLALGVAAGQLAGGILVSADALGTGWRPVFLVNVPVGLAILGFAAGRLLFSTAIYLQQTQHDSPLRSGLTFAGYAAGFAIASVTWTRVPAGWQPRLPTAAFIAFAAAAGVLAWLTSDNGWPWPATALLAVAGAAHGTGFDTLVHRTADGVPGTLAAAFSGVLATINQLAIVAGIATAGTVYLTATRGGALAPMTAVLAAIAAVLLAAGAGTCRPGRRNWVPR